MHRTIRIEHLKQSVAIVGTFALGHIEQFARELRQKR